MTKERELKLMTENERLKTELERATRGRTIDASEFRVTDAYIENLRLNVSIEELKQNIADKDVSIEGLNTELEQANRASEVRRLHLYEATKEASRLSLLSESYKAILLKIVNDADLQYEDVHGLLDEARAALEQEALKTIIDEGIDTSTDSGMDLIRQALAELKQE